MNRDAPFTDKLVTDNGSSFRGLIGAARADITPPLGIHARCWGASTHETAEGVHRPLTLTCLTFQSDPNQPPLVLLSADLMSWRSRDDEWAMRSAILQALNLDESRLMFCFTHTHSAPSLRSDDAEAPGGHLIEPYRLRLRDSAVGVTKDALAQRQTATLTWRYGRCDLASNRDLRDPDTGRAVCGFNPAAVADDTLLVGRISDDAGRVIATIVNYACHPTTLAWQNKLLSPDYVGATREVVESHTAAAPCLFLQGASGELAPAEQYTDDVTLADRHGRRLGFAVVSTLEAMEAPGSRLAYKGLVESGAPLAIWQQEPAPLSAELAAKLIHVELPLKSLPSIAELETQIRQTDDRVLKDRLRRKRQIRKIVGDGSSSAMPLWIWRVGDAVLMGQPNELYSRFQIALRKHFAPRAIAVMNLVNGSAGYVAPREIYDRGDAYQTTQSPFAPGAFEQILAAAERAVTSLLADSGARERDG